ncbi:MAG TPA: DUF1987 domain-containing protein [Bacteroidaceae bacterium]|nr:DUF1987 domain-containing protein [Bacteroidaceae bacterium]
MDDLFLKKTFNSPEVEFLADTGELSMAGRSIPEDPGEFYDRLIEWIKDYFVNPANKTVLSIKLEYINSGSSKYLLELLRIMKINHENGKQVHVKWYFEDGDESIQELGQHYEQTVQLPFEHIEYS